MKIPKINLFFKFGAMLSLVIILISSLLSGLLILEEQIRIEKDLKEKGLSIARNLAYSSEYAMVNNDLSSLDRLVAVVAKDPDVVYLQVYNTAGRLLSKQNFISRLKHRVFNVEIPIEILGADNGLLPLTPKHNVIVGQVKLGVSLAKVENITEQVLKIILGTTLLIIILGIVGIFMVSKLFIIDPLKLILTGTRRVAQGDLDYQIPIKNADEIGELAESFNQMTQKVKASREELEDERKNLEIKVGQRTSELQQKIDELEEFHRLAVGRELKMIELEDEIEKLKKTNGAN